MKKSILWRVILTIVVVVAWGTLLFPLKDKDYLTTFKSKLNISENVVTKKLKADLREKLSKDREQAFIKSKPELKDKTFAELRDEEKKEFKEKYTYVEVEKVFEKEWSQFASSDLASKKEALTKKMKAKFKLLCDTAAGTKAESDSRVRTSEKERAEDPSIKLEQTRTIESIILELANGKSEHPEFKEKMNLSHYIQVPTKDKAQNSDVVYYVRHASRAKLSLGLDLRGGTEFILGFTQKDLDDYNKKHEGRRKLSAVDCRNEVIDILRERIDPDGVKEIKIRGITDMTISIRSPVTDDAAIEEIRTMLSTTGNLQFYIQNPEDGGPTKTLTYIHEDDDGNKREDTITVKATPEKVTGEHIDNAVGRTDETGFKYIVSVRLNQEGGRFMGSLTNKYIGKPMVTVLDGKVKSVATIQ